MRACMFSRSVLSDSIGRYYGRSCCRSRTEAEKAKDLSTITQQITFRARLAPRPVPAAQSTDSGPRQAELICTYQMC